MENRRNISINVLFYGLASGLLLTNLAALFKPSFLGLVTVSASDLAKQSGAQALRSPSISVVSADMLAVDVAAPTVKLAQQRPYTAAAGDQILKHDGQSRVRRDGRLIGVLVGPGQDMLYTYDEVEVSTFRVARADSPASYAIDSPDHRPYRQPQQPEAVFRKTKPVAMGQLPNGTRQWPSAHTLYLQLPQAMVPGKTYRLSFANLGLEDSEFVYTPAESRSEAVHISQLGFRPEDPFKVGYLSTWMGSGGGMDYPDGLGFTLVNRRSGQVAYQGTASLRRDRSQPEDPRGRDYTLTEVHQLDFSDFTQPGTYQICVESVGCSFEFEIAPTVWDEAFFTAVRGFYHQRSGIAIGPPHTDFTRPRAFHPDDGLTVYQSSATMLTVDAGLGEQDRFEALVTGKTAVEVSDAWGGYFDAGDWDRNIHHLAVSRSLLELHNLFPDHFESVILNLPESSNGLPDIVDEALWSLDFFRRLQLPDGGIRGGVESTEHPKTGEASWQESLSVMAYGPEVWSSYIYAGVAARAAFTLRRYDAQLAQVYEDSALQAMAYAQANYVEGAYEEGKKLHDVDDQRNLAALELYRLTGDRQWHDLFLATTVFSDSSAQAAQHGMHDQRDAAFLYARLDDAKPALPIDSQVQRNARQAFLRRADELVQLTQTSAFGWSRQRPTAPVGWRNGLGAPTGFDILRAHALTGRDSYLSAGISATQFAAGANPSNMVFTTGMGDRSPQHPLITDQRLTQQAPPPGITVFGPADFSFYDDYWVLDAIASSTFPPPRQWPTAENYFDIYSHPISTEFTVAYMTASAYTWGYLAAREE